MVDVNGRVRCKPQIPGQRKLEEASMNVACIHPPAYSTCLLLLFSMFEIGISRSACAEDPIYYPTENTRDFSSAYGTTGSDGTVAKRPLPLKPGPYLFVDDFLIESTENIQRRVNMPQRDEGITNPIVTGGEEGDGNTAPYLSVIRDVGSGKYRIWYNVLSNGKTGGFGTMESDDGINWQRPHMVLKDPGPITWGCSVVDDGSRNVPVSERFKLCWWANGGTILATSADGLEFHLLSPDPVIHHNHDINSLCFDPIRNHYVVTMSAYVTGKTWPGTRRVTMQSTSPDLRRWKEPWFVLTPVTDVDEGETQFYAMEGYLARGDLLIGMAKILRDDVNAEGAPDGGYGIGYTTLAWTRDGKHWVRDTNHFFDPDPQVGAWDHTHAWIDDQLLDGDQVRFYYGGYKNGHKYNRFVERQIGLVSLPKDRYVARESKKNLLGTLRTVPLLFESGDLKLNADIRGELQARLIDLKGQPIAGFDFADFEPVRGDSLAHPLRWHGDLTSLAGQSISIEFQLNDASLYAFDVLKR
jgi:hypothetical protein